MKLILLVGPCGSGKSTYAQKLCNAADDFTTYINQDTQGKDHLKLFNEAVLNGDDIIVDRMGFNKQQRDRYIKSAREAGYTVEIIVFHVPRQICFDRMMARKGHPTINGNKPEEFSSAFVYNEVEKARQANSALDTFFTKYERVEDSEADKVTRLGWENSKEDAIWCDIDGCLADIKHRLHYVKNPIKKHNRWDLFFKEVDKDIMNYWCKKIILQFYNNPIVICSGRPDSIRKETEDWFEKNGLKRYNHLFMRHRNDHRQDFIIKEIILEFEVKTRYKILFAIDDRDQVVKMLRSHDITVLQADYGDF